MGDYDNDSNSGGIIGTIISILILAAIWPYLLALLGLFVAYMAVLAILEWISQNPLATALIVIVSISVWMIFYFRLIPRAWRWLIRFFELKAVPVYLKLDLKTEAPDPMQRRFIPSSNLYCYWCTKKLGMQAWEKEGKFYCYKCKEKFNLKKE